MYNKLFMSLKLTKLEIMPNIIVFITRVNVFTGLRSNLLQLIILLSNLVSLKALSLVPYYSSFTSMILREILNLM